MDKNTKSEEQVRSEQRTALLRVRTLLAQAQGDAGWDAAWKEGATPWDAQKSQPGLRQIFETSIADDLGIAKSGKALIPGCGRGYDAIYLASQGYEAIGVDISTTAIDEAKKHLASQSESNNLKVDFKVLNFFESQALVDRVFDIVYDYTFFCAIPPSMRELWGRRMAGAVKPGGHLITLVYPIDPARARDDGPPFPVDLEAYTLALGGAAWDRLLDVVPDDSQASHQGRERLCVWRRKAT
ncbi:hypothetical protein FRC07_001151 [Ceratobasidium sp. 392]|nr:hypothetical protein FRC07_001151 [Ceratobasidium sp. 392]